MKTPRTTNEPSGLRRRAEELLKQRKAGEVPDASVEPRRLTHELEVHQLELEMQNEELQAARRALEVALARYQEFFDFAPIGYFVIAADATIREANLAGARLLGTSRAPLVGQRFSRFVSAGALVSWDQFLARLVTGRAGETYSESLELVLAWGGHEPVAIHLSGTALGGGLGQALVAVEDITARKHAEALLREETRRKDEFLAVLSHELRNPLAPITNSLFVLERAAPGGEQARHAQAVIGHQVGHLTRLVDDLLDVTRIATGKFQLDRQPTELGNLVRRALDAHRADFERHGVQLAAELGSEHYWLDADATRITQALGNLLNNAVKFTPRGGQVEVVLYRQARTAVLLVRDDGLGIAPELRARLFEPFTQAPQGLHRSRGGLGLGLSVVKGLVELHGGTVEVASEGIGRGTAFTLRLPLRAAPAAAEPSVEPRQVSHRRILVIEDNIDAADSLRDVLEMDGHEVAVAYDGPSGLERARELRPEIILCDIGLPGMDGYEVARALRADDRSSGSLLVALTGYALPEDAKRATDAGFDRFVPKPPNLAQLEQLIADAPGAKPKAVS